MTTALLIIDVQQGLCTGAHAAFDVAGVLARINHVAALARGAGAPVVLIQHEAPEDPLRYGSAGWQLAEGLEVAESDRRLRKTATDAFHRTELQAVLQAGGVIALVICGLGAGVSGDAGGGRPLDGGQRRIDGGADHGASQRDVIEHHEFWRAGDGGAGGGGAVRGVSRCGRYAERPPVRAARYRCAVPMCGTEVQGWRLTRGAVIRRPLRYRPRRSGDRFSALAWWPSGLRQRS